MNDYIFFYNDNGDELGYCVGDEMPTYEDVMVRLGDDITDEIAWELRGPAVLGLAMLPSGGTHLCAYPSPACRLYNYRTGAEVVQ